MAESPSSATELPGDPVRVVTVDNHAIQLFRRADEMAECLCADIRAAQERVLAETFIFSNDEVGVPISQALQERAGAGLDVRVIYDAVGSMLSPPGFFGEMAEAGVKLHAFHAGTSIIRDRNPLRKLNRRTHRKLTTIDDRVAYFGGINFSAERRRERRRAPHDGWWHDLHVRMEGDSQQHIARAVLRHWDRLQRGEPHRSEVWPNEDWWDDRAESIRLFDFDPQDDERHPDLLLLPLMDRARRELLIAVPYFLPTGEARARLEAAARRGVDVQVQLPGRSDMPMADWAAEHVFPGLLDAGIRLHRREDRMVHMKTIVVDGEWTVIGSANLDPRSRNLNREFSGLFRSKELAVTVAELIREEREQSREVTIERCRAYPWWRRLRNRIAYRFRAWL